MEFDRMPVGKVRWLERPMSRKAIPMMGETPADDPSFVNLWKSAQRVVITSEGLIVEIANSLNQRVDNLLEGVKI